MAKSLKGVEIFAVGRWRGNKTINVTSADLDAMVASFNELSTQVTGYKPFLKLGHQEQQAFFGQKTGAPNLGVVERIWRDGEKILADFANVPDQLLALIENRRYNAVSIEMYPEVQHGGKAFKNVLTAVALLGAELPAVKGLKELAESLFAEEPMVFGDGVLTFQQETGTVFTQEQVDALVAAAVKKAQDEAKASFAAEKTALEARATDAEKERDEAKAAQETAQKALFDYEQDVGKKAVVTLVEDAIKAGKILPKAKADMIALGQSMNQKVKLGEKEVTGVEAFKAIIDNMGKQVDLSEKSRNSLEQAADAGMEVDKRARQKISDAGGEGKLSYADARQVVLNEDPDLKARYAQMAQGA